MNAADRAAITALKMAHERMIAEDPADIVINRTEQVDDGAGGTSQRKAALPSFTGRLVASGRAKQRREVVGGSVELAAWTLFAPGAADVKKTKSITDTFTLADGREFEVALVRPLSYKSTTYGFQAEVVEVV